MRNILVIVFFLVALALTVVGHESPADYGLIKRGGKKLKHRKSRQRFGKGNFNPPPPANTPPANAPPANAPPANAQPANAPPAKAPPAPPANSDADFNQNSLSGNANPQVCNVSKLSKTGGTQNRGGSCANTQLGEVPSVDKMVSTLITSPPDGSTVKANTPFTITAKSSNIEFGNFDNPDTEYYAFSQQLNKQGFIKGHSHVTVQQLNGGIPDPTNFAFFKGLNDKSQDGSLSVTVTKGVPAGKYRLCTMTASFAHAPVVMPVAQRGAQDDCIRFNVQ